MPTLSSETFHNYIQNAEKSPIVQSVEHTANNLMDEVHQLWKSASGSTSSTDTPAAKGQGGDVDLSPKMNSLGLPDIVQPAEQNMQNWVSKDFSKVADGSGHIPNKQAVEDYIQKNYKDMSYDELKGWQYLENHFNDIQGSSKFLNGWFQSKDGITQKDVNAYINEQQMHRSVLC